jgi:hypothetical protein
MSRFLTTLKTEKIGYDRDGRPLARVLAPLAYESDRFGLIEVPAGFVTNFASVPRLPVIFLVAGDRAHEQAAVHDLEYTLRRRTREEADDLFLEALGAPLAFPDGMDHPVPGWLAKLMYKAVRVGGQSSWDAESLVPQPARIVARINAADLVAP